MKIDGGADTQERPHCSPKFRSRRRWLRRLLIAGGAFFSVGVFIWTQLSMLFYPGWGWQAFRLYYWPDQLANLAIVVNGAHGNLTAVEPFTETGTNNDPHLYFFVLGAVAHFAHIAPADVYNLAGVALQIALVMCLSVTAVVLTSRWWAAYLGAAPYLIGTLSFSDGSWSTTVQSHAVLWGPFGSMFALNGASASLAIAAALFMSLLAVATRYPGRRALLVVALLVGAGIGLLANIDTYSFITASYFALYGLATFALASHGRWWPVALSLLLVVVVFVLGPGFASSAGRLAALVVGLLPAIPGISIAVVRWRKLVIAPLLVAIATAAPQVVGVWTALEAGNPFLKLREASSVNLGVSFEDGVLCAVPLLVPLILILLAGLHRRRPLWIAYATGVSVAWFLVATNDVWGPNQEPYQLWVDGFALTAFSIIPIVLDVGLMYLSPSRRRGEGASRPWRAVIASLLVLSVSVALVSSIDWYRFYRSQENQTMSLSTPPDRSMEIVAKQLDNEQLVMTDPCVDPEVFKAVTGARVDYYSPGLAWPARYKQINRVTESALSGVLRAAWLRAAGIGWLVTDAACPVNWAKEFSRLLTRTATSRYGSRPDQVITLWRLRTGGSPSES